MATDDLATAAGKSAIPADFWKRLKLPTYHHEHAPIKNANEVHDSTLTPLERTAVKITDAVGSMGFFIIIFMWTILWCGFNILATEFGQTPDHPNGPLPIKPFDPFPSFVAYLLISNVIQIMLMPLIMVGQNLQGRHSEVRAQLDFEINQKAEKEVMVILRNLEHNTDLTLQLMRHLECRVTEEELRALTAEKDLANKLETVAPADADKVTV